MLTLQRWSGVGAVSSNTSVVSLCCPVRLAQLSLRYLPQWGNTRDRLTEFDRRQALEAAQLSVGPDQQFFLGQRISGAQGDQGQRGFPPALVRNADNRRIGDRWVLDQYR